MRRLRCHPKVPRPLHEKADLARQAAWKGKVDQCEVWFINEMPTHAARQAVLVDRDTRVLGHRQLDREIPALVADRGNRERITDLVIAAEAGEIGRQFALDTVQHDLKDAAQVLTCADRAGDYQIRRSIAR